MNWIVRVVDARPCATFGTAHGRPDFLKKPAAFGRLRNWHPLFPGGAFSCNNTGMNKTITLTDQQHSLLLDLFSSIADLDLQEHCDDSSEFDALWDAVIDAK